MTAPRYDEVEVGFALPTRSVQIQRYDLVRYGGSACDYNPIHWDERTAASIGLPHPITHGMLTMGVAIGALTAWTGDPAAVVDYGGRWPRPVPVPNDGVGAELEVSATVAEKLEPPLVRLNVTVRCAGATVLTMPRTMVALRSLDAPHPS
jgi:acyl dehydratase